MRWVYAIRYIAIVKYVGSRGDRPFEQLEGRPVCLCDYLLTNIKFAATIFFVLPFKRAHPDPAATLRDRLDLGHETLDEGLS